MRLLTNSDELGWIGGSVGSSVQGAVFVRRGTAVPRLGALDGLT